MRLFKNVDELRNHLRGSITAGQLRSSILEYIDEVVTNTATRIQRAGAVATITKVNETDRSVQYRIATEVNVTENNLSQVAAVKSVFDIISKEGLL